MLPALNGVPWWFTLGSDGFPLQYPLPCTDPLGPIAEAIPIQSVIGTVVCPACSSPAPGVTRHNSGNKVVAQAKDRQQHADALRAQLAQVAVLQQQRMAELQEADVQSAIGTQVE